MWTTKAALEEEEAIIQAIPPTRDSSTTRPRAASQVGPGHPTTLTGELPQFDTRHPPLGPQACVQISNLDGQAKVTSQTPPPVLGPTSMDTTDFPALVAAQTTAPFDPVQHLLDSAMP